MIRLIATDMDGTLLEPGGRLPDGLFEVIEQLNAMGIRFAAASGRQYDNLYRLFAPASPTMGFIAENGGVNAIGKEIIDVVPMATNMVMEIVTMLHNYGLCTLLSGAHCCYSLACDKAFSDAMVYIQRNTMAVVDRFDGLDDDIVKISAFQKSGIGDVTPKLLEKWGSRLNAARSGEQWFDFTLANKGTGIRALTRRLGLKRDEVAVFGDNFNDVSMFDQAGHPFLMKKADPALRKPGIRVCEKVLPVIRSIIANGGELPDFTE